MNLRQKLERLSTPPSSDWVKETAKKIAEQGARRHARHVALVVLDALDAQGITQQALADRMGVSRQQITKIVKGKENLTFETVAKLENALNIEILSIKGLEDPHERPAIATQQMISVRYRSRLFYGGGDIIPRPVTTMLSSETKTQYFTAVPNQKKQVFYSGGVLGLKTILLTSHCGVPKTLTVPVDINRLQAEGTFILKNFTRYIPSAYDYSQS